MVGVPGRAIGCITCRRRKKGCDRRTPACRRCIRAELACEGYETDMIWLNSNANTAKKQGHTESPQPKAVSEARPWIVSYTRDARPGSHGTLQDSFARSSGEQLYFGLFWNIMIPEGARFSPQLMDLASVGWTSLLGDLYNSETALRFATIAIATSVLARLNNDEQLCLQGLQVYNWTVQEMIRAVKQPSRAKSDSLILAARLMAFYELHFGPERDPSLDGWQRHSKGQLAMFLARGPSSFISGAAQQLFVDTRINFKTIPWAINEKSTKDKLLDIMENIPYITALLDSFSPSDSQVAMEELRAQIWQQCRNAEAALAEWRAQIDLSIYDYTMAGLPLPKPQTDSEFSLLYLSCTYWSTRLMLSCIMGSIPGSFQISLTDVSSENATGTLCLPLAGAVQGASGLFPMACAWRFYEMAARLSGHEGAELQILYDLSNKPFMGKKIEQHMAHLQRSAWKDDLDAHVSKPQNWTAWF
ncbi:hypothetical protein ACQKWADRAFT_320364 [Trichoderma austrokoningii]